MVRCVAMDNTDGLDPRPAVKNTNAPISMPVGPEVLGRIMNVVGEPVDEAGRSRRRSGCRSTGRRRSSPTRA
jgi:F-type H+-transporting ATPase subunit beta